MSFRYQTQNLSALATISYGYTASASFDISGPRFLRITDIQDGNVDWEKVPSCEIDAVDHKKHKLKIGDIVFARTGATTGKSYIILEDVDAVAASYLIRVRLTSQSIAPRFVWYFFQSPTYWHSIASGTTGSAQGGFNASKLGALDIPIPPLEEQESIVAILDEAFDGIATATATAERNFANAQELFEEALDRLTLPESKNWETYPLKQLATKIGSGATPRGGRASYKDSGIALIRSMNVHDRRFKEKDLAYLDDEQARLLDGVTVQENDVLLNITGASVARCCIAPQEFLPARVNQHVAIIRSKADRLLPEFLCYFLTARRNKSHLLGIGEKAGATRQAITKANIESFEIAFPAINSQRELVDKLNELEACILALFEIAGRKISGLAELKQSVLRKAFSGKLTSVNEHQVNVNAVTVDATTSPQYTADVLAFAYAKHRTAQRDRTFGRVKGQKVLHLVEAVAGVDLGRDPVKDAAGPNDSTHMRRAEDWAAQQGCFAFEARGTGGYDFKPGRNYEKMLASAYARLSAYKDAIAKVVDLLVPLDSQEAEVLATVHAAWNNLIIDGIEPTRDAIIAEARENWAASKLDIPVAKFEKAIRFIRQNNIIPDGSAKAVRARQESLF